MRCVPSGRVLDSLFSFAFASQSCKSVDARWTSSSSCSGVYAGGGRGPLSGEQPNLCSFFQSAFWHRALCRSSISACRTHSIDMAAHTVEPILAGRAARDLQARRVRGVLATHVALLHRRWLGQ
jgi:hypothetical protein